MKKIFYVVLNIALILITYPIRRYLWKKQGYVEFQYKTLRGLCRQRNGILEILAIKNLEKHNGVFGEFLKQLNPKKTFFRKCLNEDLYFHLLKKGFMVD